ncbi:MAG: peptide MFS transporter [Gammaproteobacteria bacterium]|nr:peptide MFS transporter [Gammaproteobacteria bacterium]
MSENNNMNNTPGFADVKQLGLFASIASLSYVFWIVGGMEMVERLAYYGVRTVAGIYATDAKSIGGLGVTATDLGVIFLIWAFVQSLVPALIGGLSDRLGYKLTIFISTVVKIAGYLIMAYYPTFMGFTVGAIVLATGTGIFKPGVQGTLVKSTNRENSSMAWGIFYQTVNIGGWLGPLMAAQLRQLSWDNLFFACAAIISLNFILLLTYKEPNIEERLEHRRKVKSGEIKEKNLIMQSLEELAKPQLSIFLLIMSGFWFMFNAFFDVLPLHIRDWVDTSVIVSDLFGTAGTESGFWIFILGMNQEGTALMPEGLLNVNAGLIMLTCFLYAHVSGKLRAINSIILGTILQAIAFFMFGYETAAWVILIGILIFSSGEMFSSPKFLEFVGNFAPSDKKAMYLGFSQLPQALGWAAESFIGPWLYDLYAAKDSLSRNYMGDNGFSSTEIAAVPIGEAFTYLVAKTGESTETMTRILYDANNVGMVWNLMAIVAIITAIGLYFYGKWVVALVKSQPEV